MADNVLVHEENRGIHRLVMDHGPNALDPALMSALRKSLGRLAGEGAPAVILASSHPTPLLPGLGPQAACQCRSRRSRGVSPGLQYA